MGTGHAVYSVQDVCRFPALVVSRSGDESCSFSVYSTEGNHEEPDFESRYVLRHW